jgi:hypothetical protein
MEQFMAVRAADIEWTYSDHPREPETEPDARFINGDGYVGSDQNTIDYSWSVAVHERPQARVRREQHSAHARGSAAACRLYQRLALGAVFNDRVGDASCLWALPGCGALHSSIAAEVGRARLDASVVRRYTAQGWGWHVSWVRNAEVARLYRSRFGQTYVPGTGTARALEAQRARASMSVESSIAALCSGGGGGGRDPARIATALDTAARLLRNVLRSPGQPKFRRVRLGNARLRRELFEVEGGERLLRAIGWSSSSSCSASARTPPPPPGHRGTPPPPVPGGCAAAAAEAAAAEEEEEEEEEWLQLGCEVSGAFLGCVLGSLAEARARLGEGVLPAAPGSSGGGGGGGEGELRYAGGGGGIEEGVPPPPVHHDLW